MCNSNSKQHFIMLTVDDAVSVRTRFRLKIFCLLLYCSIAAAQEAPQFTANAPFAGATISDFKGKVGIQFPSQTFSSPFRGEVLPPETVVNTEDGRLLLQLSDGSDILVHPHTRLVLKQPETSGWHYIELSIGRIRTQIQKHLGGTPAFQMGTPSAVISVRGTRFDVEVNHHGVTEVDVEEGVVQLDSVNRHGESVVIAAGFSSRVGIDSGPETPRPTRELRPDLERPGHMEDKDSDGEDDSIKKLKVSDREHRDQQDERDQRNERPGDEQPDPGREQDRHPDEPPNPAVAARESPAAQEGRGIALQLPWEMRFNSGVFWMWAEDCFLLLQPDIHVSQIHVRKSRRVSRTDA